MDLDFFLCGYDKLILGLRVCRILGFHFEGARGIVLRSLNNIRAKGTSAKCIIYLYSRSLT